MLRPLLVTFTTNFSAPECRESIRASLAKVEWSLFGGPRSEGPVVGKVGERWFFLYRFPKQTRSGMMKFKNSFSPALCGRFVPIAEGTKVQALFMFHPFVMIFIAAWVGIAIFVTSSPLLAIAALLEIAGIGLILAAGDFDELATFLHNTCGG